MLSVATGRTWPVRISSEGFLLLLIFAMGVISFLPLLSLSALDRGLNKAALDFNNAAVGLFVILLLLLLVQFSLNLPAWRRLCQQPSALLPAAIGLIFALVAVTAACRCVFRLRAKVPLNPAQVPFYRSMCRWIAWCASISLYFNGLALFVAAPARANWLAFPAYYRLIISWSQVSIVFICSIRFISALTPLKLDSPESGTPALATK